MSRPSSASSHGSGTAQDLSFADQQELLAFIEKRNWFEQKLDSLKALAPVYPFVHPLLVADPKSTAGYVRAGAETSPWRLPDRGQLSAWVTERNALEDEVARFDDGDMDRMKEKTRQMTRVPLTQPSTDLVEVTLDLILLIDQLLTVLRRRGAVLELASLRLQWDDLRHEANRESDSVNSEIQHVVAEAQAWIPGAPSPERVERRTSTKLLTRPPLHSSPSTGSLSDVLGATPGGPPSTPPASPGRPPPSPGRKMPASPTKQAGGPKSSLHLSILRSQLVGLQSRQRNFAITLVKRSSGILDKMIDMAGRLEGLGGITGPLEKGAKLKGAVPEELIDLQEAIEENAKEMNDRVKWCGEFETQCRQAHQHYMSSLHAQHAAGETIVALEKALTTPASSERHAALAKQYSEATKALPPVVDGKFPRPSHEDYPSKDVHNERLVQALQATRDTAKGDVNLAGKGLAFYSGMVKAREALLAQHHRVQTLRTQLTQTMEQLERGTASVPRPNIESVAENGGECSEWLSCAAGWMTTGDEVVRSATDTHQSTTLAAMQYRKALVSAPLAVKKYLPANGVPDDLGPVVDDDASDLISLARRCAELTKTTRKASEAIPLVLCIRQDGKEVADDATSLQTNIVVAINQAAWTSRAVDDDGWPAPNFGEQIRELAERTDTMGSDLQRLQNIHNSAAVSQPLNKKVEDARELVTASKRTLETLSRVSEQAKVVVTVQSEAETLISDITAAREAVPKTSDMHVTNSAVQDMRQRVAAWNDELTVRVVFVSDDPPTLHRATSRERSNGHGPLTPPLTPVDDTSTTPTSMPDFVDLDLRVRNELNRQSARVSSALSQLVSAMEDTAFDRWAGPVIKATTVLEGANENLGVVMTELTTTMERVKAAKGEERKKLAEEAQKSAREILPEPIIEVQQCIAALNEALGGTSSNVEMHRAADVFSSADVAREAGLAKVTESEEWQKDVSRLILEAEVSLQRQKAQLLKAEAQSSQPQGRSSSAMQEAARDLADKLDALDIENVVRPTPIALRTTPKHRRLPSSAAAKKIASQFSTIKTSARTLSGEKNSADVDTLFSKLKRTSTLVPELGGLGAVGDAASACDDAFSKLLETIDTNDKAKTKTAERKAERTVEKFRKIAKPHKLDQRVVAEIRRINAAWDDLRSLAEDEPVVASPEGFEVTEPSVSSTSTAGSTRSTNSRNSNASRSSGLSRSSTTNSISSLASDTTVIQNKKSVRNLSKPLNPTRNFSMPPPDLPKKVLQEQARPRVASDTPTKPPKITKTPSYRRQSVDKSVEKRSSSESVKSVQSSFTPSSFTPRSGPRPRMSMNFGSVTPKFKPTVPVPFNFATTPGLTRSSSAAASLSDLAGGTPTRRGPRMSAPPRTPMLAPTPKIRRSAHGATKLDQAVAKVLDTLDVDVPVVPVGRDSPEQWHDESGRYWIGTGGKSRLCFCRILRSRTVMVRVGGGWVELSRYLMDRFADALADAPPARETMSMSPPDWRRVPMAITSATLAATANLTATVRSDNSLHGAPPRTPVRKPLPAFDGSSGGGAGGEGSVSAGGTGLGISGSGMGMLDPLSPTPEPRITSLSPASAAGQTSPLVPIQFIRKASESPSIREREREQMRTRPNFLREGSSGP